MNSTAGKLILAGISARHGHRRADNFSIAVPSRCSIYFSTTPAYADAKAVRNARINRLVFIFSQALRH
ncbi:MAG: hypothetical protein V3S77_09565 [Acidiferrobacterales bacterium]